MRRWCADLTTRTTAPPSVVYSLVTQGATWPKWAGVRSFTLERADATGGEGPGAVRAFRVGPVTSRVVVVECVPHRRYGYRLLSGLPVRDYQGVGTFAPGVIRWRLTFTALVPGTGWLLRRYLQHFVTRFLNGLAHEAERSAAAAAGQSRN
ncbi:SRPBCC family protein [Streptomyces sp. NPDC001393]